MKQTVEYKSGIYTGEVKDGLPNGYGKLEIDDRTFEGQWKEGKKHGAGYYTHISSHDYDGLDCRFVYRKRGIWTDGILSGVVWEYRREDDTCEKITESCSLQDEYGLTLLGIDRDGKLIGALAEALTGLEVLYDRGMLCRQGNRSWGKIIRDGHTFIGQFSSEKESPYYADDYLPHGFCIETDGDKLVYCGTFCMGERKGAGVIPSTDPDVPFTMTFQII